ncbi:MAG: CobW family GTP-binding protein [Janthinobacterium lividum]
MGETHHRPAAVPILLVTGFLGAGKTTAVNHLLTHADGRRIAAVVNDFGAINIDAELIADTADNLISLANGCICCSLEGDLLRTLATLLRRDPRPEYIVIETSGIADPADIVRNLMDPVIWKEAPLETILCIADATTPVLTDALAKNQIRAADIVALSKTDLADPAELKAAITALKPTAIIIDAPNGQISTDLLFPPDPDHTPRETSPRRPTADRFETLSWTTDAPLSLPRLQSAIGRLSPKLARAKGFFETVDDPGRQMLLQLAAGRATLSPAAPRPPGAPRTRLVFIAELGTLTQSDLDAALAPCAA